MAETLMNIIERQGAILTCKIIKIFWDIDIGLILSNIPFSGLATVK